LGKYSVLSDMLFGLGTSPLLLPFLLLTLFSVSNST
jgi:hypothetical protein